MAQQVMDKKEEYIEQRDNYKVKCKEIYEVINIHKEAINKLDSQIINERPKTENGKKICEKCDCISLAYAGRTPQGGLSGGEDIYECEICEKTYYSEGLY
jgi:predicted GTPase